MEIRASYNEILDRFNGSGDRYNGLVGHYNGTVDRDNRLVERYNEIINRYNEKLHRYNRIVDRIAVLIVFNKCDMGRCGILSQIAKPILLSTMCEVREGCTLKKIYHVGGILVASWHRVCMGDVTVTDFKLCQSRANVVSSICRRCDFDIFIKPVSSGTLH